MKEERELRSILTEEEATFKKTCWSFLRLAWELKNSRELAKSFGTSFLSATERRNT